MAVVVQCFHCNTVLELDEGFRGGVCRCSGCGSLLQVPKGERDPKAPKRVRPAGPPAPSSGAGTADGLGADPRSPRPPANRSPSIDASGMSSGLRQVHKTRPIRTSGSRSGGTPRDGSTTAVAAPAAAATPAAAKRGNRLLWTAVVLFILIVAVVVALVAVFIARDAQAGAPGLSPVSPVTSAAPHGPPPASPARFHT